MNRIFNDVNGFNWISDHCPVFYKVWQEKEEKVEPSAIASLWNSLLSRPQSDTKIVSSTPFIVMSFNTLGKMFSKANCPTPNGDYSNNPWDETESNKEFCCRVSKVNDYIIDKIKSGHSGEEIDFICLQEFVHFVTPWIYKDKELKNSLDAINKKLTEKIEKLGWGCVSSEKGIQPLVTFYNKKRFTFMEKSGQFETHSKCRALESIFTDSTSNNSVCVTNMHLDFQTDYRYQQINYLKNNNDKNLLTVLCGDTNHPPNKEQCVIVNDWNKCTNIDANDEGQIIDQDESGFKKCYDGLGGSPAKGYSVVIEELAGLVFEQVEDDEFQIKEFTPNPDYSLHESEVDLPWIRRKHLDLLDVHHPSKQDSVLFAEFLINQIKDENKNDFSVKFKQDFVSVVTDYINDPAPGQMYFLICNTDYLSNLYTIDHNGKSYSGFSTKGHFTNYLSGQGISYQGVPSKDQEIYAVSIYDLVDLFNKAKINYKSIL